MRRNSRQSTGFQEGDAHRGRFDVIDIITEEDDDFSLTVVSCACILVRASGYFTDLVEAVSWPQ